MENLCFYLSLYIHRGNASGGVDVMPEQGIDAIVSYPLEEAGSHILRVEVGYVAATDGNVKTFRKFYRFQVTDPFSIRERTIRCDEESCLVAISVEFNNTIDRNASGPNSSSSNNNNAMTSALTICGVEFLPAEGLSAERIGDTVSSFGTGKDKPFNENTQSPTRPRKSGVELLDNCGRLESGHCYQYLFKIKAASRNASMRGIAAGDELGKAVFTWSKTMGETGRIASSAIRCPASIDSAKLQQLAQVTPDSAADNNLSYNPDQRDILISDKNFVVHGSGLSVDVAAAAAKRAAANGILPGLHSQPVDQLLPVTVEPIRPPTRMQLAVPQEVQFLVMNHTSLPMSVQLQLRFEDQKQIGLAVCGHSFKSLGELPAQGGCTIVTMRLTAITAGLLRCHGCYVVDLATGKEIAQPPLFDVFVDHSIQEGATTTTSSQQQTPAVTAT